MFTAACAAWWDIRGHGVLTFTFVYEWRIVARADVLPSDSGFIHLCEDSLDPRHLFLSLPLLIAAAL